MPSVLRALVVALVLVLAASACSSGGNGDSSAETSSSSSTTTSTTAVEPDEAAADSAADQDLADSITLMLSDFPSGWREEPREDDDQVTVNDVAGDVDECADYADVLEIETSAESVSPEFVRGDAEEVRSDVAIFATTDEAQQFLEGDQSACFRAAIPVVVQERVEEDLNAFAGVQFGELSGGQLSIDSQGDETVAYQFVIPLMAEGIEVDQYLDLVYVRVGRAIAAFTVSSQFSAIFEDDRDAIVQSVVARMEANRADLES